MYNTKHLIFRHIKYNVIFIKAMDIYKNTTCHFYLKMTLKLSLHHIAGDRSSFRVVSDSIDKKSHKLKISTEQKQFIFLIYCKH